MGKRQGHIDEVGIGHGMPAFPGLQGTQGRRGVRRKEKCVSVTHDPLVILLTSNAHCHLRVTEKEGSSP